jgi:hypothetical protein
MTVDATSLFFAGLSGGILKMNKGGGTPTAIVATGALISGLSADATSIYWSAQNLSPASIMRAAKDGTGLTTLASAPGSIGANRMVIDSTYAYYTWQSPAELRKVPLVGGAFVTLAPTAAPSDVAVGGISAYWGDFNGHVSSVLEAGGTPSVVASLASGQQTYLAADACGVYYGFQNAPLGIWFAPFGGGAPTMLATTVGGVDILRVDASHVYWAEINLAAAAGPGDRIMRVGKDGSVPLQLAGNTLHPQTIAVDDQFVYWSDLSNSVYRVAK